MKWWGRISIDDMARLSNEAGRRWRDTDDAINSLTGAPGYAAPVPPEKMTDKLIAKLLAHAVMELVHDRDLTQALLRRATWERGVMLHAIERDVESDSWIKRNATVAKIIQLYREIWPKK